MVATDAAHTALAASIADPVLVIQKRAKVNLIATLRAAHAVPVTEVAARRRLTRQNTKSARAAETHTRFMKSHLQAAVATLTMEWILRTTATSFWPQPRHPSPLGIRQHQHPWQTTTLLALATMEANGFYRPAQTLLA